MKISVNGLMTSNRPVLEICVESLDRAMAAERGGADRIELCADLSSGGVTPDPALMRDVRRNLHIPIHVLIRPRAENYFCPDSDFEAMRRDICRAKELGSDGVVLGILQPGLTVDRERTAALVELAHPLPVTFHRAFDLCADLMSALEAVIETGAQRILTSGGKARASDGLTALSALVTRAGDRIVIMPGGGVRASNVRQVLRQSGAREVHTSLVSNLRAASESRVPAKEPGLEAGEFEIRVRKFLETAQESSSAPLCKT